MYEISRLRYEPVSTSDPEYIRVYNGQMAVYSDAPTVHKKYMALKQLFLYMASERFELKPIWLDILQYKHIDWTNGIITTSEYTRQLDADGISVLKLLLENIHTTITDDTYIIRSQRTPGDKASSITLGAIVVGICKKYGISTELRSKRIDYHRPSQGARSKAKKAVIEYESYEQILHKKFNTAKKNIKARLKNKGLPTHDSFGWESVDDAVQWGMELLEQMDYRCPKTNDRLSKINNKYQVSLDRIDSDLGYTPHNVELVTAEYNMFKMDRTPEQVLSMCERVLRANMGNNTKHKSLINQLDNNIAELEMLKNSFSKQLDHYKNKLQEDNI
jgi:hypothetical protein